MSDACLSIQKPVYVLHVHMWACVYLHACRSRVTSGYVLLGWESSNVSHFPVNLLGPHSMSFGGILCQQGVE